MFIVTHKDGQAIRYASLVIPPVAALANSGAQNLPTPDDNKRRRLVGVYSTLQAKLTQTQVGKGGSIKSIIDNALFAATRGFHQLDWTFDGGVVFQFSFVSVNPGGPAIVANTDELIVMYECDPDV